MLGWVHLACVFWNSFIEFTDHHRVEVKIVEKMLAPKHKCIYCGKTHLQNRPMIKQPDMKVNHDLIKCTLCKKCFHVRCAIKRGLITDHETMAKYQYNSVT